MKDLIFSQTSIYHLQKLKTLVSHKTGVKHHLAKPASLINLLRYSATTPDQTISTRYVELLMTLSDEQKHYLQSRGLLIPAMTQGFVSTGENYRQAL